MFPDGSEWRWKILAKNMKKHHWGHSCLLLSRSSPEDDVIIKITAGTNAGDGSLWSETRFDEGPRVEHAQQGVEENLQQERKGLKYTREKWQSKQTGQESIFRAFTSLPFGAGGWYRLLGRYPVKMLSSLGITHQVSPTSILFFGGRNALNWLAKKDNEGTAGLFQERRPLSELWETWTTKKIIHKHKDDYKSSNSSCFYKTLNTLLRPAWSVGRSLTPRKPSLLFVMELSSSACMLASKTKVSPVGSWISSSSKSTGAVIPVRIPNTLNVCWCDQRERRMN